VTQGFYNNAGQPLLDRPLRITGHFTMTANSVVVSTSVTIVHFHLAGIRVQGFPPALVREYLKGYLGDGVGYVDITFDVGTREGVELLQREMSVITDKIQR
jgi:hypothetical protein